MWVKTIFNPWGRASVPRVIAGTRICKSVTRLLVVDGHRVEASPNSRVRRSIVSEEAHAHRSSVLTNVMILPFSLVPFCWSIKVPYVTGRELQLHVREACWMKLLPLFAVLNKKKYRDEAFVHVLNFTCNWPIALRKLLRRNCSIKLKRSHHNLALDEFVETMLVRPLKVYARKQTTVSMLQKISMNLEVTTTCTESVPRNHKIIIFTPQSTTSKHTKQDSTRLLT